MCDIAATRESMKSSIKLAFKPGVCRPHTPGFLKLILCGSSVCVCVCVCPRPQGY